MKCLLAWLLATSLSTAQTLPALIAQCDQLDKENKNAEALDCLREADSAHRDNAEILRRMAGQYDRLFVLSASAADQKLFASKALESALRAVRADSHNAKARLGLAIAYGRVAGFESARRKVELSRLIKEEAEAAARLNPREEYAWHILGRWNYELSNFNPVLLALAQGIYGRFPDASNEKAAQHFQKAVAINPKRAIHHIELGRTYLVLGEVTKARREFETGLALPSMDKDDEEARQRGRAILEQLP